MNTEEARQLIQELETIRRQTYRFRILTVVALLVIVLTGVSAIIESFSGLAHAGPRQEVFLSNLNTNLQRDLLPIVQKIAGRSVDRLKPAIERELQDINGRAPEVADVALSELDQMGSELLIQAGKVLDQTVTGTLQRREGKLRKMFPEVYDKQIDLLVNNLALEAGDQLGRSSENVFNPHLNSVQTILTHLDKIQRAEPVDTGKNIDAWQVAFMFMDVFVHEFKDMAPAEPEKSSVAETKTKAATTQKAKEKKK
jgi:hypothetical protein